MSTFFVGNHHGRAIILGNNYLSDLYSLAYSAEETIAESATPERTIKIGAGLGVPQRTFVNGKWLAALLRWEERRDTWFDHVRFLHVFGLVKQ